MTAPLRLSIINRAIQTRNARPYRDCGFTPMYKSPSGRTRWACYFNYIIAKAATTAVVFDLLEKVWPCPPEK